MEAEVEADADAEAAERKALEDCSRSLMAAPVPAMPCTLLVRAASVALTAVVSAGGACFVVALVSCVAQQSTRMGMGYSLRALAAALSLRGGAYRRS